MKPKKEADKKNPPDDPDEPLDADEEFEERKLPVKPKKKKHGNRLPS